MATHVSAQCTAGPLCLQVHSRRPGPTGGLTRLVNEHRLCTLPPDPRLLQSLPQAWQVFYEEEGGLYCRSATRPQNNTRLAVRQYNFLFIHSMQFLVHSFNTITNKKGENKTPL
jgi:hypothetical protein